MTQARYYGALAQARRGPTANDRLGTRCQAAFVDFQCDGGDVGFLQGCLPPHADRILVGRVEQEGGGGIDQVKHRAQVHRKAILTLADKNLAIVHTGWAARYLDAKDVFLGVGFVRSCVA